MDAKPFLSILKPSGLLAAVSAGLLTTIAAVAFEISGQVMVPNWEGPPLTRFGHAVVHVDGIKAPPPAEPERAGIVFIEKSGRPNDGHAAG
jgi:hypothetical protein